MKKYRIRLEFEYTDWDLDINKDNYTSRLTTWVYNDNFEKIHIVPYNMKLKRCKRSDPYNPYGKYILEFSIKCSEIDLSSYLHDNEFYFYREAKSFKIKDVKNPWIAKSELKD